MDGLLREDSEMEFWQVSVMDFNERKAVFIGIKTPEFRGEIIGDNYVVLGNLLARKETLTSMGKEFGSSCGKLAQRLAMALKVEGESGGDKRGEKSAALIVVSSSEMEAEIKGDTHKNPIDELLRRSKALWEKE